MNGQKEKRESGEDKGKRGWKEVEENVKWKADNKAREGKRNMVEYVLVRKIWLTKIQKKGVEMNRKQGAGSVYLREREGWATCKVTYETIIEK